MKSLDLFTTKSQHNGTGVYEPLQRCKKCVGYAWKS